MSSNEQSQQKRSPQEAITSVRIYGTEMPVGKAFNPLPGNPGWSLQQVELPQTVEGEMWVFSLAPGTGTAAGIIEFSTTGDVKKGATIEEYILKGSGWVLFCYSNGQVELKSVNPQTGAITYGPGTAVAYFAGPEGLTGVNLTPAGFNEPIMEPGDPRIHQDFWRLYQVLPAAFGSYSEQPSE